MKQITSMNSSIDWKKPKVLINGDNVEVLDSLTEVLNGKVSCIYIDPPYNTGESFAWYSDFSNHEVWVKKITLVLKKLKSLLNPAGSIWISINDMEMPYLRIACDKVFGRESFIATIIWQQKNTRDNRKIFSNNHEYVVVYSPNPRLFKEKRNLVQAPSDLTERYFNPDNDPRGPWQSISLNVQDGHAVSSQFYEITTPSGRKVSPPKGRCWAYNQEKMDREIAANNIYFGKNGNAVPRRKKFLSDSSMKVVPETIWLTNYAGTTQDAKKQLVSLRLSDDPLFDTPKPEKLIWRILSIATQEDDIVLDAYLGSGTTCAVAHKMGRNYIGIEINSALFNYATKRMDKVISGDKTGISKDVYWTGGGEYQVIKF